MDILAGLSFYGTSLFQYDCRRTLPNKGTKLIFLNAHWCAPFPELEYTPETFPSELQNTAVSWANIRGSDYHHTSLTMIHVLFSGLAEVWLYGTERMVSWRASGMAPLVINDTLHFDGSPNGRSEHSAKILITFVSVEDGSRCCSSNWNVLCIMVILYYEHYTKRHIFHKLG